jgi:hypothetical protein
MTATTAPHRSQGSQEQQGTPQPPRPQEPQEPPAAERRRVRVARGTRTAWAEDAKANIANVRAKLAVITARRADQQADPIVPVIAAQVEGFLAKAHDAAWGFEPRHRCFRSWWNGTSTEAAYRNLHYAESCIAHLYAPDDIRAELPDAVRRANGALAIDDPTRLSAAQALTSSRRREDNLSYTVGQLSMLIGLGHEAADRQRARLRTFRNVMLVAVAITSLLAVGIALLGKLAPDWIPLCFTQTSPPPNPTDVVVACPSGQSTVAETERAPGPADALLLVFMGAIGGALSSLVFIRGLYANSTPYNVAVPLAMLKIPAGALVAMVGTLLLAGDFVPGFSAVDRQPQILAYALLFGFAQQLVTRAVDQRAKGLIANVPTKSKDALAGTSVGVVH